MTTPNIYRWPCPDCKRPNSSRGVTFRCPECAAPFRKLRNRESARVARARQLREQAARERRAARKAARDAVLVSVPETVTAIDVYRAEKAARVKLGPADDFAEARLQLLHLEIASKPKRGRPKKSAVQHSTDLEDAA